jgi:glycosyltransferase involved in cell wall biosynthesis
MNNMKTIILFDQDTQHYRQSMYLYFREEFQKLGYGLIVVYDKKLNEIETKKDFFIGINYSFQSFKRIIKNYNSKLIIQFVWLRYKFLIPFMIWYKLNGGKIILWSHGINLQKKDQPLKNQLYYLRQKLANALIIYTPEQKQYLKTKEKKVFVANNTLYFNSLPKINSTKEELVLKYGLQNKKIILCVGRMNTNNRKINHLIALSKLINDNIEIIVIGPGVNKEDEEKIKQLPRIQYLGPIFNQNIVCEYYKLSDIFVMPGAIGLAINQSFYYGTPVIVEDVEQGPEAYYLKDGVNGFYYSKGNVIDLMEKIYTILKKENYKIFSENARQTILEEASISKMLKGFIDAINYVNNE